MIIVSCYYNIPSKRSKEFYYGNIRRFFEKLIWQKIYFFTDKETHNDIEKLAGPNVEFIIQEFEESRIFNDFPIDFWKKEILNDPEKYHTWQLGALWGSKSYFVKQVSDITSEEWLVWVDAGCVRADGWNLNDFTRRNTISEPGVYLQLLNSLPSKEFFEYPDVFIAGSHILFHRSYISEFIEEYKKTIIKYEKAKKSLISDQHIMNSMCKNSSFLKPIIHNFSCPDPWFFMFYVI